MLSLDKKITDGATDKCRRISQEATHFSWKTKRIIKRHDLFIDDGFMKIDLIYWIN